MKCMQLIEMVHLPRNLFSNLLHLHSFLPFAPSFIFFCPAWGRFKKDVAKQRQYLYFHLFSDLWWKRLIPCLHFVKQGIPGGAAPSWTDPHASSSTPDDDDNVVDDDDDPHLLQPPPHLPSLLRTSSYLSPPLSLSLPHPLPLWRWVREGCPTWRRHPQPCSHYRGDQVWQSLAGWLLPILTLLLNSLGPLGRHKPD